MADYRGCSSLLINAGPPHSKTFSTANAYRDHITSRKHRETILKKQQQGAARKGGLVNASAEARKTEQGGETADPLVFKVPRGQAAAEPLDETASLKSALPEVEGSAAAGPSTPSAATATTGQSRRTGLALPEDATEEEVQAAIDEKISRSKRIDPNTTCLFCISGGTGTGSSAGPSHQATHAARYSSMDEVLAHMRSAHSFFIPERDYLEDLPGLLTYLADKISVGNICLYCNGKGRGFASREAVQGHMLDKAHCKIAYDAEEDRLELGDFYDFSSTYPDAERYREKLERRKARREEKLRRKGATDWQVIQEEDEGAEEGAAAEQGEWEDEDAEEAEEEEEEEYSDLSDSESDDESDFSDDIPQARLGDSEYELVLPSGLRLGHRSMKRYYDQTSRTTPASADRYTGGASGRELARRLIENGNNGNGADKGGTLVKGRNGLVVQAKSKGEAKEAKRHIKEFRDVKRREEFKTKVAYKHNSQVSQTDPCPCPCHGLVPDC